MYDTSFVSYIVWADPPYGEFTRNMTVQTT